MQFVNPNKMMPNRERLLKKNCCQGVSSTINKGPDANSGVKMHQKLLSCILLPLVLFLWVNNLLNMSSYS